MDDWIHQAWCPAGSRPCNQASALALHRSVELGRLSSFDFGCLANEVQYRPLDFFPTAARLRVRETLWARTTEHPERQLAQPWGSYEPEGGAEVAQTFSSFQASSIGQAPRGSRSLFACLRRQQLVAKAQLVPVLADIGKGARGLIFFLRDL